MTDILTSSVRGLVSLRATASDIDASLVRGLVSINYPAEEMITSEVRAATAISISGPIETSQVTAMVVARGRIENPRLRAWTYTLDGHDFYVLRLGDNSTFVYDLTTKQWSRFTSANLNFWRANLGMNWRDAMDVASVYGSNVIVGDDNQGILWLLDPNQGYDDSTTSSNETPVKFPRVATGQIVAKSREYTPIFEVWLNGSNGNPSIAGDTVTLNYSDDAGHTYVTTEPIAVEEGNYNQELSWMSLGRFSYPGRIFRIEDEGALARIDGMDVNHGSTAS